MKGIILAGGSGTRLYPVSSRHDRRYAIDSGKIQRELGWTPRESFASGLRKTVRWYLERQTIRQGRGARCLRRARAERILTSLL